MRLFVGGIPFAMTEEELRDLFAGQGEISSLNIITDRETGRSRGFGFVDMPKDEEARSAIQRVNGQQVGGRSITVNEAQERRSDNRGGGGGGGYRR